MPTVEQRFHERVTARALADTLAQLSPRRTISAQSLVEANIEPTLVQEIVPGAPLLPTATADLPRITLDHRAEDGQTPVGAPQSADFEVLGLLGEGGMGRVLLARQHSLARDVAIKTSKEGDASALAAQAILQESRIMGALEHPGIVPVHALGLGASGNPLLVMKRIEGVSLRVLLDDPSHPGWKSISGDAADRALANIEILIRVCRTLAFAHSRGVVHRDIKPDNVMIGAYGETYLCDWGIATHVDDGASSDGMLVGTPAYMAPEMLLGGAIDARTDVYLLGATLHEMLTGRPRHDGASMHEILHSVAISSPSSYDADVPPELARLCNRATSSDPRERPASADAFRKELSDHLHQRGAMVLCEAAFERLRSLEALLAAAGAGAAPGDLAAAYRHATEARFGFAQSLRIHPELEAAKRGRERALIASFDLELRQRHVETAAALLDELSDPPPHLVSRLSDARREADAHRLEAERLRAIARDLDPTVDVRSRMLVLGAMSVSCLVVAVGIFLNTTESQITPVDLVIYALVTTIFGAVALLSLRRRLGETLFNRRIVAFFAATILALLAHRLVGWHYGETVRQMLTSDTVMLAAMIALGVVTLERRLVGGALVSIACIVAMIVRPERVVSIFQIMTVVMIPAFYWAWKAPRKAALQEAS